MRGLRKLERLFLILGPMLLAVYFGTRAYNAVSSQVAMETFRRKQLASSDQDQARVLTAATPDFGLWSPARIKEYAENLVTSFAPAIGILRIPKLAMEVPVLNGTDELSLNRGVGHIAGTAAPGREGNIGIAGHRDGFFRSLKDVVVGDTIEMVTATQVDTYIVDQIIVVDPSDTSVLRARGHPSLTLVTCYPFYFVGSAPNRYVVEASRRDSDSGISHVVKRSNIKTNNLGPHPSSR